jgi:hypothetical protein
MSLQTQPTSESEWRLALVAVHPDRIGSGEVFIALSDQREAWRKSQPAICRQCRKSFQPRRANGKPAVGIYCTRACSARSRTGKRLVTRKLVPARSRRVRTTRVVSATVAYEQQRMRHFDHAQVFGASFIHCQHTACVDVRRRRRGAIWRSGLTPGKATDRGDA